MLFIIIAIFFILILPILFQIELNLDLEHKRYFLILKLFFIKVLKKKVVSKNNGLYIIKGKKEEKITVKIIKKLNNNIDLIKDYHIISIKRASIIGDLTKYENYFFYNMLLNKILLILLSIKKPYIKSKNKIEIVDDDIFELTINISILINLLIIVLSIIKFIIKGIRKKWKEKKTELKTLLKQQ